MSLWAHRVLIVTGKGGVGKSATCAALGLAAARAGRRVLICETQGAERMAPMFGVRPGGYSVIPLAPEVRGMSITSDAAIEDYLLKILHFKKLYQMVFRNRIMGPFMDAVPGLHDLIQLGKVMEMDNEGTLGVDLYIIDAPATGHALAMLTAPRTMMDLTVRGPFHENTKKIADLIEDPVKTGIVLVSTAEDLPVSETLDLYQRLGRHQRQVRRVVLNEAMEPVFTPESAADFAEWRGWLAGEGASAGAGAGASATGAADTGAAMRGHTLRLAEVELRRQDRQRRARERLAGIPAALTELPFLYRRDLGPPELQQLSRSLDQGVA